MGRFGLLFTPSWHTVSETRLFCEEYLEKIQYRGGPEILAEAAAGSRWNIVFADERELPIWTTALRACMRPVADASTERSGLRVHHGQFVRVDVAGGTSDRPDHCRICLQKPLAFDGSGKRFCIDGLPARGVHSQ